MQESKWNFFRKAKEMQEKRMGNVGESSGIIVINNNQRLYPKRKNGGKMDFLHGWGKTGWKTKMGNHMTMIYDHEIMQIIKKNDEKFWTILAKKN